MKRLLKSARILDKESELHQSTKDILIENGIITEIVPKIEAEADEIIKSENLHVSRGWFDSSVAFGEPGLEENETLENGLKVAAQSGFTDILLNPLADPIIDSQADVEFLSSRGKNSLTRIHPIGALTQNSAGKELTELYEMQRSGAKAFGDFKQGLADANLMKIALQYAQNFSGLICAFPLNREVANSGVMHEQHQSLKMGLPGIPNLSESLQITRDLHILEYTGGKLHIPTISTREGLNLIADAKNRGLDVSCSVALHQLWFTDEVLGNYDANFKVLPPLRSEEDRQALLKGVKNGNIDMITSDHIPINIERKKCEFEHADYGSIGLESAFSVLNSLFDTEKSIELLTRGRSRFSIKNPQIKTGEPANFTLFNPDEKFTFAKSTIKSTSKNSAFLGEELKGKVIGSIHHDKIKFNG